MKIALIGICVMLLSGCATWPEPRVEWYHAASPEQAEQHVRGWIGLNPMRYEAKATGNSNGPIYAKMGTRWLNELVGPGRVWTKADLGLMVVFVDDNCLYVRHMIIDVSPDGRSIRTSGLANRRSDPWISGDRVVAILRMGVTSL